MDDEFNEILNKDKETNGSKADEAKQELTPADPNPEATKIDSDEKFKQISKLGQDSSAKWGGSINFLSRYVTQALKRIKDGPKKLVDPEIEFINQDKEDFFQYKCKEIIPNERYSCEVCKKVFKGEDFVIKHIKNKHQDVVAETYERESTQDWLERTISQKLKKEMK